MSGKLPAGGIHREITLEHSQEWELYHNSFSLCSKKVRLCMAELGLPYRSHHIDLIETGAYDFVSVYDRARPQREVRLALQQPVRAL